MDPGPDDEDYEDEDYEDETPKKGRRGLVLIDVWITAYALTKGIFKARGEVSTFSKTMVSIGYQNFHGKDWHRTEAEAIKRAEEMRQTKLASIAKQDRALRKRDMSVVKEWK